VVSFVLNVNMKPELVLIILGNYEILNKAQHKFLKESLITAKNLFAVLEKTVKLWLDELMSALHLEQTRHLLKSVLDSSTRWDPFICFLCSKSIP